MVFTVVLLSFCFLAGCGKASEEEEEKDESGASAQEKQYEYDALQSVFIGITLETTEQELEEMIADQGLYYTTEEYSTEDEDTLIYNLALTEESAKQENAQPGDHLEVWYEKSQGAMMLARYFKAESSDYTGLLYGFGTWYDFKDIHAEDYSGYYVVDSYGKNEGIKLKHTDGKESRSNYFACDSAEEVIDKVIRYFETK